MASRSFIGMSLASVVVAATMTTAAVGQENLLGELYGIGVHSYYASEYREAYSNLSAAIEAGSKDPRAYYFRGLALSSLGRAEEAQADFEAGAQLEVSGGEQYAIGKSLERVQGTQRLAIERVRKIARIRYQQEQLAKSKKYYQEKRIVDEPTLDNQPDPTAASKAVEGLVDPTAEVEGGDPFGGEGGLGVGAPTVVANPKAIGGGPAVTETGEADPFGTEEPAVPAGDDDPFGGAEPAPPAGGDPFGGAEPAPPAGGDPFGGAEPAPPAGGDPFGGAEPAGEDGGVVDAVIGGVGAAIEGAGAPDDRDPFDDTDEPKEAPPAIGGDPFGGVEEPPAGGDPFGGAEPEPPAGGDPFGGAEPEPPAGGDPFGGAEPEPPAGNDPFGGAEPAAPAPDDPFGGDGEAPAADDPFGAPDEAPVGDDPFGAAPDDLKGEEGAGADPFGGPATPADGPVENAPSDDPFGAPVDAPAEDDPFGAAPDADMEKKGDPFGDDAGPDPFGGAAPADGPADNAASDDPFAPAP